jgi:hypothetical protein
MKVEIELLKWQKRVYKNRKRFTIISAGRQSGKTFLCVFIISVFALQNDNKICWWVAPTYEPAKMAFRRCIKFLIETKIQFDYNKSNLTITIMNNGSTIQFKSGDREEGLRGESVDLLILDEMGLFKRDSWQYALRGTITATNADAIFIGTPKGKNLFHELYCKGLDPLEEDYISYQFESKESDYFSEKEWEEVKKLPQRIFEQEYQAKFIDDGGEVFRNIKDCIKGQLEKPSQSKSYFAGIDLAKSVDYTVICILDQDNHLCFFDRFNQISWNIQKERIINAIKKYNAVSLIDSTGVGDPILEDLNKQINAQGFKFTNVSKRQLIESFSMAIEKQEVSFPDIPELTNELNIFTFDQTQSGNIRYNAPDGMNDDIVIALALAYRCGNKYKIATPVLNYNEKFKSKVKDLPL